ncbi:ATP-dependent nuclease [Anaerostipes sp. MSJ-23]|uniref:ATP-dependent nuclease n=1 Tax=Anaerostipes sp. MSJ-23 TaxID=2841520 RepID=UPI001C104E26|nr:AAA family ATPase [Anaerostipes sp. MSJ-23]MBU5459837.1 AAA family ATPase [Anaerostipes sp. MSJ-23]
MEISHLSIKNFKSIRFMELPKISNALILVGKNNAGKSSVLHALRAVEGSYEITLDDFNETMQNIEIEITLSFTEDDLQILHKNGFVSQYKKFDLWKKEFCNRLPSYHNGELSFTFIANKEGTKRYFDGIKKHNKYISQIFPTIYFIGTEREFKKIQDDLFILQEDNLLKIMRTNCCMFNEAKPCKHCFHCIGLINQKTPKELNAFEASKLFEYKLYQMNIDQFEKRINESFHKNGGYEEILFSMNYDVNQMLQVEAEAYNKERDSSISVEKLGRGMKSIYMLSLLEAYVADKNSLPSIIMVEEPEMFLHPQLQKTSSEILYRLSQKNQVIFTTHSPHLLSNFGSRQICQIVLDENFYSIARKKTKISTILDDLGYSAADLMNVNFVFIVEGKQDKYRLPLLLNHYYSEIYDESGNLNRVAIITTNSCTNIKTYANLKYMNQIYMKDQFLMIRDSDGKDPEILGRQLCKYYDERNLTDVDRLPKVSRRNVLILKYYSFENYFLNPKIMKMLGIISSEEAFYDTLFDKWKEYLHRIKSGQHLLEIIGKDFTSAQDMKEHMEEIKIYLRGHNLFDIFYGPYKKQEKELLKRYIQIAPREEFQDILDAADDFIYFKSKKKDKI